MSVAAHLGIDLREYDARAKKNVYVPLADEIDLLARAGFTVDIAARRHAFAVIVASK